MEPQRPQADPLGQGLPGNILQNEIGRTLGIFEPFIDGRDVRMVQTGQDLGLAILTRADIGVTSVSMRMFSSRIDSPRTRNP